MGLTAQKLILDVVSAATDQTLSAHAAVVVARPFNITENAVRVALVRLQERGRLERVNRGRYSLASGSWPVQRHVSSWTRLEQRCVTWRGQWCGVYLSRPSRIGRQETRRRGRALDFLGLRELEPGLWVRPDNLSGGVVDLRERLVELGLDVSSRVFAIQQLDGDTDERARGLWDTEALLEAYRDQRQRLQRSAEELTRLGVAEAMVEAFLAGGRAIGLLAFDPLLPEAILPGEERRTLLAEMLLYNRQGRGCWRRYAKQQSIPEIVMPSEWSLDEGAPMAAAEGG